MKGGTLSFIPYLTEIITEWTMYVVTMFVLAAVYAICFTVFSPVNGLSKKADTSLADNFFSPAEFWSKSHKKLSKRRTGN